LNGHKKAFNFHREITDKEKQKDVAYLQQEYEDWNQLIQGKTNGSELINYISQETKNQLKELDKYCEKAKITDNMKDYLTKSIVLLGKYIYLQVKEFNQEHQSNEIIVDMNNEKILIDSFTFVHTMFRHFSQHIKQHQHGKSYHFDENIEFSTIPYFIQSVLECFKTISNSKQFKKHKLIILFNGKPYAIWLRPYTKYLKGNNVIKYLRVQTLYPIEERNDLSNLKTLAELKTNCGFSFLIDKNI